MILDLSRIAGLLLESTICCCNKPKAHSKMDLTGRSVRARPIRAAMQLTAVPLLVTITTLAVTNSCLLVYRRVPLVLLLPRQMSQRVGAKPNGYG